MHFRTISLISLLLALTTLNASAAIQCATFTNDKENLSNPVTIQKNHTARIISMISVRENPLIHQVDVVDDSLIHYKLFEDYSENGNENFHYLEKELKIKLGAHPAGVRFRSISPTVKKEHDSEFLCWKQNKETPDFKKAQIKDIRETKYIWRPTNENYYSSCKLSELEHTPEIIIVGEKHKTKESNKLKRTLYQMGRDKKALIGQENLLTGFDSNFGLSGLERQLFRAVGVYSLITNGLFIDHIETPYSKSYISMMTSQLIFNPIVRKAWGNIKRPIRSRKYPKLEKAAKYIDQFYEILDIETKRKSLPIDSLDYLKLVETHVFPKLIKIKLDSDFKKSETGFLAHLARLIFVELLKMAKHTVPHEVQKNHNQDLNDLLLFTNRLSNRNYIKTKTNKEIFDLVFKEYIMNATILYRNAGMLEEAIDLYCKASQKNIPLYLVLGAQHVEHFYDLLKKRVGHQISITKRYLADVKKDELTPYRNR